MPATDTVDVIVIGAGAAGVAAARRIRDAGLGVVILEARDRIGGRAWTQEFDGVPVDLGAHWLHAARANPLVSLARQEGLQLSRAIYRFRALKDGRKLGVLAGHGLDAAWWKTEDRIFDAARRVARGEPDLSIAEAVGNAGPWTEAALFMHGAYDCGADPATISTLDFARVDDDKDMLVAGGVGGLLARLAKGLDILTGVEVVAIRVATGGVAVTARDGRSFVARKVILAVPLMVLKAGAIAIDPVPEALMAAAQDFIPAAYEHAVLRAAQAPWSHRSDQIILSASGREHIALFAHMEGGPLHYLDMVAEAGHALAAMSPAEREGQVRAVLGRHFGDVSRVDILHVTGWAADPLARGAWAMARIGRSASRQALRQGFGALTYAGEAASTSQWGTVGGAWLEGERAAAQALAALAAA